MAYSDVVLADTPLAYYRLDEAAGPTLVDSSGNLRDGSWTGSPTFAASPLILDGTAVDFTASGQRATVPYAAWMNVPTLTVEAWVNLSLADPGTNRTIASRYDAAGTGGWRLYLQQDWVVFALFGGTNTYEYAHYSVNPLTVGQTYHIVACHDGTTQFLYLNGALDGSVAAAGNVDTSASGLIIGARESTGFDEFYGGRIDEVALYSGALSAARIGEHYTAGTVAPPTNGSDTFNRTNGRTRSGTGFANLDEPVSTVPATLSREPIRVMAQTLPTPTLEKGRPV